MTGGPPPGALSLGLTDATSKRNGVTGAVGVWAQAPAVKISEQMMAYRINLPMHQTLTAGEEFGLRRARSGQNPWAFPLNNVVGRHADVSGDGQRFVFLLASLD